MVSMKPDHLLITEKRTGITDADMMSAHIKTLFGYNVSSLKDSVLILMAIAGGFISYEQFFSLYESYTSSLYTCAVNPLLKSGYIERKTFKEKEGNSKGCLMLTKSGYQYANSLCDGRLHDYHPLRGDNNLVHSYYVGWVAYQMMALGWPFDFYCEVRFGGSDRDALRADAVIRMKDKNGESIRVFVEQDMGTEQTWDLVSKIKRYELYGLMENEKEPIIFTVAKKGACIDKVNTLRGYEKAFSKGKCAQLLDAFRRNVGRSSRTIMREYPDQEYFWAIHGVLHLIPSGDEEELNTNQWDEDAYDLEEFYNGILRLNNPLQSYFINGQHNKLAKGRIEMMRKYICRWIDDDCQDKFLERILEGQQILFIPTTALVNYMKWGFIGVFEEVDEQLPELLRDYQTMEYLGVCTPYICLMNGKYVRFRNHLRLKDELGNTYNAGIECMHMDLGAHVRVTEFLKYAPENTDLEIICLFEDYTQLVTFYASLGIVESNYRGKYEGTPTARMLKNRCKIHNLLIANHSMPDSCKWFESGHLDRYIPGYPEITEEEAAGYV